MRKGAQMKVALIILAFSFIAPNLSAKETTEITDFPDKKYGTVVLNMNIEVTTFLEQHFGDFQIPLVKEFSNDMLSFYYSENPPEAHPAYCSRDFNSDGFTDYAFILRDWASQAILIVLNGINNGKGNFDIYIVHGVRGFNDDYLLFDKEGLYRGNYEKDGFRINWSDELSMYISSGH